jgi:hypothetical protein
MKINIVETGYLRVLRDNRTFENTVSKILTHAGYKH